MAATSSRGPPVNMNSTVEAKLGELVLTSEKLPVAVGRPNLEFEKLDLDEKMLGRIAAETHGSYVPLASADQLLEQLDRTQKKTSVYVEQRLYWPPGFWAFFVAVLYDGMVSEEEISTSMKSIESSV